MQLCASINSQFGASCFKSITPRTRSSLVEGLKKNAKPPIVIVRGSVMLHLVLSKEDSKENNISCYATPLANLLLLCHSCY
mmetsp:Transcript_25962/g.44114  ORF Transcript_25962/g.44114 Transcript_25962/m.44114 type:complete len:81 (+) Transcript_25962:151-393(+)